jgi:hypothetical protein
LVTAFGAQQWVAEEPGEHLLPHVRAWCELDQRLALASAHSDDADADVLDLEWQGPQGALRDARAAVFALIGRFAESATYVRQRRVKRDQEGEVVDLLFEVGTGEFPDTLFETPLGGSSETSSETAQTRHTRSGGGRNRLLRAIWRPVPNGQTSGWTTWLRR